MMDDEKLIQLVSYHEELYDLGNKLYFDVALKNKRWQHIAVGLNKKADECKQRWESLRAQFRKVCKARNKSGQACKKRAKWRYEDEMAFLLPHMNVKRKSRAFSLQMDSEAADVEDVKFDDSSHDLPLEVPPEAAASGPDMLPYRETTQDPLLSQLVNYILRHKDLEARTVTKKEDSVDLFFESIKATVRNFSPGDFHSIKTRIFNMVSEVEAKYVFADITNSSDNVINNEVSETKYEISGNDAGPVQ